MLIAIIASMVLYYLVYRIIKPLTEGSSVGVSKLAASLGISAGRLVLHAVLYVLGLKFSHIAAYNTLKNLRCSLQRKMEKQPLGTMQEKGSGRIIKLFTDDIEQVELLLAHAIPEGIANLGIAVIAVICMFFADWRLALLSLGSLPLGMFAMGMMFKSGMAKMNDYYTAATKMNNTIIEYVNGMEVVKVFGRDGESYKRYENDIKSYRDFTLEWYRICWPWMALYSALIPCVALITIPVGTLLVINGVCTLADLVLVVCLSLAVGMPLLKAMSFAGKFPQLNYKIAEIEKAMEAEPLKTKGNKFTGNSRDISFKDVSFGYNDEEIIHSISLDLKQGTMTALVGESGSGKSTLARLLVHYYDISGGSITIGGQDITDMSLEALNEQISYVSQEQFLFNTSLYENILLGNPSASREQVLAAANQAQCDEFLQRLPDGFDTVIGEGGASLSGGQAQRISIARCILKDSPIVILDEATASVDADNESYIQEAISELCKGKTLIVIAHRLNTIENADKILVISGGKLAEQGTHSELMQKGGIYCGFVKRRQQAAMWKM